MNKVLFALVIGSLMIGCTNDPTLSEALCNAQQQDPTAVCTGTEVDTSTDTSFFTDEEEKAIEEAVEQTSSTDTDTQTAVE